MNIILMPEEQKRPCLCNPQINYEASLKKARFLEVETSANPKPAEVKKLLIPEKKYPGAIIFILLFIFFTGCMAPRHIHSGITYEKVTSAEKIKDGTVVAIVGSRGRFIVLSDTVKIGDSIPISWIQPIRHK